jgi:hypothetical protein
MRQLSFRHTASAELADLSSGRQQSIQFFIWVELPVA